MLGDISKKYESGNLGPGAISSGAGDPGGKSYGCYQLAIKTGTLQAYLQQSQFKDSFDGLVPGTANFDAAWKQLASQDPTAFEADQRNYIKETHFDPVRAYADDLGIEDSGAINEALFSIGVQHGRWKKILDMAVDIKDPEDASETDMIHMLYSARRSYVVNISLPESTRKALLNRYISEERDVIGLIG